MDECIGILIRRTDALARVNKESSINANKNFYEIRQRIEKLEKQVGEILKQVQDDGGKDKRGENEV